MVKQFLVLVLAALSTLSHAQPAYQAEPASHTIAEADSRRILVLLRQGPAHYRGGDSYEAGYGDARSKASREVIGKRLAKEHGVKFVGLWPMPEIGLDCLILEAREGQDVQAVIAKIEKDKAVEWAEPVATYQSLGAISYNDPLFSAEPAATQWYLAELHQSATGKGVTIAIIDSGIDANHPDLAGQVQLNRNFVEGRLFSAEAHGTGVAGVIAAKANNQLGMVGVAPRARLLGLRACWQTGGRTQCDSLSLAKALHFAIEKDVDVINLSLTGPPGKLLAQLIAKAIENGTVVVAAVDPARLGGGFPASSRGVVAVTDNRAAMANSGGFRAPGHGVPTTQPNGKWFPVDGSSFAAAHVSGLFALLIEKRRSGTSPPILVRTSDGSGKIDTRASLRKAGGS